jgi:hypothetical protein
LLGPKISPRVAGIGEIKPVDGVAENSEFCARACGGSDSGIAAIAKNISAGPNRRRDAAVDTLFITSLFSAEIEAISSRVRTCL